VELPKGLGAFNDEVDGWILHLFWDSLAYVVPLAKLTVEEENWRHPVS
jgi:hypothetical protein